MTQHPEQETPAAIVQSTERLFGVRQAVLADDVEPVFFKVDWDDTEPAVVNRVTTMTLEATGARRGESRPPLATQLFRRAQYLITEVADDNTEAMNRYIWCDTDIVGPLETPTVDVESVAVEHGYKEMTTLNVVGSLMGRVEKLDEHIQLLSEVDARTSERDDELDRRTRQLAYRAMHDAHDKSSEEQITSPDYKNNLFAAISFLNRVSPVEAKKLQSQTLSQLFRELPHDWTKKASNKHPKARQEATLDIIADGLETEVFSEDINNLSRIFVQPNMYRRPYVTRLLHDVLSRERPAINSVKIFKTNREIFTHLFMHGSLSSKIIAVEGDLGPNSQLIAQHVARMSPKLHTRPPVSFAPLFSLARRTGYRRGEDVDLDEVEKDRLKRFLEIPSLFKHLLSQIDAEHPISSDADLDPKRIEIVRLVLDPPVRRLIAGIDAKETSNAINDKDVDLE